MKASAFAKRYAALVAVATLAVLSARAVFSEQETAAVGKPAPDFALKDEQGTRHTLAEDRGKIVVLEWTNSECPFVQRHYKAGTMTGLAAKYAGKVVWLAVNSTYSNTPDKSQAWMKAKGIAYPTLQDPTGAVGHLYSAKSTPDLFVIDEKGVLRYEGAIDNDPRGTEKAPTNYVAEAIDALLAGQNPPVENTRSYGCSVKYATK